MRTLVAPKRLVALLGTLAAACIPSSSWRATGSYTYRVDGFKAPITRNEPAFSCQATVRRGSTGAWTVRLVQIVSNDQEYVDLDFTSASPRVTVQSETAGSRVLSRRSCARFDVRTRIDDQRKIHATMDVDCDLEPDGHVAGRAAADDCTPMQEAD